MTKFYKLILVCCAALFLTACAHPDMIKLNDTYDHTVKELGVPDSTTRLPDGSIRIVYSMQPMGQTSYVMIFNPEGRLIFKDQLLQQKYFNQIKPKVQSGHLHDVRKALRTMALQELRRTHLYVPLP